MGLRFLDRELYPTENLAPTELLQLTLASPDSRESVCMQFGAGTEVAIDGHAIECRAWQEGMRYTAIAALPAAMFGKQRFESGDEVELRAAIRDRRDSTSTQWQSTLQLD